MVINSEATVAVPQHDLGLLIKERILTLFRDAETVRIPKQGGSFTAQLRPDGLGIDVDNLASQPFLEWNAFCEAVAVVMKNGGRAQKGDAMGPRLGDQRLPLNSVEGWVAHHVYGRQRGDSVFRRVVPLVRILEAARVFEGGRGWVALTKVFQLEMQLSASSCDEGKEHEDGLQEEDNLEPTF